MKAQIVSFHCVLRDKLGKVLSSSFNHEVINQLGKTKAGENDQRLQGLIAGIQDVCQGEIRRFTVPATEAYGPYNPELVLTLHRSDLPLGEKLAPGTEIVGQFGPNGSKRGYRVVQIKGDTVVLDGNHPLAGHDLEFEIEVISARDARSEDLEEPSFIIHDCYIH